MAEWVFCSVSGAASGEGEEENYIAAMLSTEIGVPADTMLIVCR